MKKILLTALALSAVFVLALGNVRAHDFYEAECCNGNAVHGDCQPIASSTVTPTDGGYIVTLKPGDHRKVTRPHTFVIPKEKVRYAPDAQYHICLWPTEDDARCFYAPPMGS